MGKGFLQDTKENIEKLKRLYLEDGMSGVEIANILGCSLPVVQRFLHRNAIYKNRICNFSSEELAYIKKSLEEGKTRKQIANDLHVPAYIINRTANTLEQKGKYSNILCNQDWIEKKTALFWYFLGIFGSDGHLGKFNEIDIFQKDGKYLKDLQEKIGHSGKLYGEDKTCYVLRITDALLHKILEEYGYAEDKRYNAPFINIDNTEYQALYIRGLFDGDGSLYYKYISGVFYGLTWEITTGSLKVAEGIKDTLEREKVNCSVETHTSNVGNLFYRAIVRNQKEIIKLFNFLYSTNTELSMKRKYNNFKKLVNLIHINNQVDEIVELPMKMGK